MIGLGRMGGNMSERLMKGGHEVVVFDRSADAIQKYVSQGATGASSARDVTARLKSPRVVWIMVPAGKPVDDTIATIMPGLAKGDVIIDGGNSNYHDTMRRAKMLEHEGIEFIDSGTSGGIWGLANGYCLMIGATPRAFKICGVGENGSDQRLFVIPHQASGPLAVIGKHLVQITELPPQRKTKP